MRALLFQPGSVAPRASEAVGDLPDRQGVAGADLNVVCVHPGEHASDGQVVVPQPSIGPRPAGRVLRLVNGLA